MHIRNFKIALSILGLALMLQLNGQKFVNSPYSRFGLGMIEPTASFRSAGMGGVSVALRDNVSVTYANPASYSSFDTISFVLDIGLDYSSNHLKSSTGEHTSDDFNFDHIILSFPISKRFGFAFGVVPYSNGYYNLGTTITPTDPLYDPEIGVVNVEHTGSGGYTRTFFGTGLAVTKSLSLGLNMNVLFGEIERSNGYYLPDPVLFSSQYEEKIAINGIYFDAGLQYQLFLKDKKSLNFGLAYTPKHEFSSSYSNIFLRESLYTLPPYSPDTVSIVDIPNGKVTLPQSVSFGVSYIIADKLTASVDYVYTDWNNAKVYGAEDYLVSTHSINAGAEYIPNKFSSLYFLQKIEYRLGARLSGNYLMLNNEQVKEYGITFGVGIPLGRAVWSKMNFFFDYTNRGGSLENGLHKENIYSVGLSFNLYDYWFVKRKYD